MPEIKQKQPQDRKTIFETLSLPVAKILSPVARQAPTKSAPFGSVSAPFGSVWLRFGSVLAPFRVCFGSVSGPFRGVGWGRGGVGERGFCKGKEYHYLRIQSGVAPANQTKERAKTKSS